MNGYIQRAKFGQPNINLIRKEGINNAALYYIHVFHTLHHPLQIYIVPSVSAWFILHWTTNYTYKCWFSPSGGGICMWVMHATHMMLAGLA